MAVGLAHSAPDACRDGPSSLPPYVLPRAGGSVWESNPPPTCLEPDTGFEVRGVHRRRKRLREANYLSDRRKECTIPPDRPRCAPLNRTLSKAGRPLNAGD